MSEKMELFYIMVLYTVVCGRAESIPENLGFRINGAVKFRLLILIELGVVTGNWSTSKSSFARTALPGRVDT